MPTTAPHRLKSQRLKARIMPVMTDRWMTAVQIAGRLGADFEALRHHLRSLHAASQLERREADAKHGARKRYYYRRAPDANPA